MEDRVSFSSVEKGSDVEIWIGNMPHTYTGCEKGIEETSTTALAGIRDAEDDIFIFLKQEYSWGHLLITEDAFGSIRQSFNPFPALNDHIASFALKTSDRNEHFATCDRKIHLSRHEGRVDQISHELCYLLRYPARNGRKNGHPFSLRQMAIYQQFDQIKQTSRWIFVQGPNDFADELRRQLSLLGRQEKIPACDVHRRVFQIAEQEWRDYICYLDDELSTMEEKAFFVDVDVYDEADYSITFADSQKLQRLRRTMIKCKEILDCCLEVAQGCKRHWQDVRSREVQYLWEDPSNIESFISRTKVHHRGIQAIMERADGTANLLSQILNHRNEDMLVKSNNALRKSSDAMHEIALAAKGENQLISALIRKSQKDSRTVKILTYVSLIYLPASLVAEIFNSNLVQTRNGETDFASSRLILSKSFWLYPCITLALMSLTFLPVAGLLFRDRLQRSTLEYLGRSKRQD